MPCARFENKYNKASGALFAIINLNLLIHKPEYISSICYSIACEQVSQRPGKESKTRSGETRKQHGKSTP